MIDKKICPTCLGMGQSVRPGKDGVVEFPSCPDCHGTGFIVNEVSEVEVLKKELEASRTGEKAALKLLLKYKIEQDKNRAFIIEVASFDPSQYRFGKWMEFKDKARAIMGNW